MGQKYCTVKLTIYLLSVNKIRGYYTPMYFKRKNVEPSNEFSFQNHIKMSTLNGKKIMFKVIIVKPMYFCILGN